MNAMLIVAIGLGIFYSLIAYIVAGVLINMAYVDGSYERGECSIAYDVFVLLLAPIMIPFEIFVNWHKKGNNHV